MSRQPESTFRTNATRALLPALAVLALVGVVAIAATGSTATGSNAGRAPSDSLLDTILTLVLISFIPAAAIYLYGMTQRKAIAAQAAALRMRRLSFLGFAVFIVLLTLAVYFRLRNWKSPEAVPPIEQSFPNEPLEPAPPGGAERIYDAEFAWIPLFVVIGLAAVAAVAFLIAARRSRSAMDENETIRAALATALDDSLDDLRAETDPRRAVIAAYARLERVLAAHGFPRDASETPDELLARILPRLDVDRRSIRRLTDLFTWAKFSQHDVDTDMKEDAIAALEQVRDELRASAEEQELLRLRSLRAGEDTA